MTESLKERYARLLREGRTTEATRVALQAKNEEGVEEPSEEVESSESDRFAELKGVGGELAVELVEEFGDFESFVADATVEDLTPIPGIGEKRAESLLEQVE